MSNYVVDASVVTEYLITGIFTSHARAFFHQVSPNDRLIVPEFCILECTNVLWKQIRFQGMSLKDAQALLKHLKKLPLIQVPMRSHLNTALIIGAKHQLAIYDSLYVALAMKSSYPLITLDVPQSRVATAEKVILKPLTDF